jgi:protein-L-isoaspartate(D-aspartate) O-methyltransferase
MDFEQARFNMIEQQIRTWNVLDQAVLNLLTVVKREQFVSEGLQNLAFTDCELPIRINGQESGEFMLEPKLEARLLQEADIHPHHKVLEIGTGTGYLTALLAEKASHVTTIESNPAIAELAIQNFKKQGTTKIKVIQGCGFELAPTLGKFDLIVLSGSSPVLPEVLLNSLSPKGQLIGIIGEPPLMQAVVANKSESGTVVCTPLFETHAKKLHNAPKAVAFVF